jgi:lysozyme family protein
MTAFDQAFAVVVGEEGGYDATRADPGNWTGGEVGEGELLGTKYGCASADWAGRLKQLPEDVRATMPAGVRDLTLDQAKTTYRLIEWAGLHCDDVPAGLALVFFDAAVNNGASRSTRRVQEAVGAFVDGSFGPQTLAAVRHTIAAQGWQPVASEFLAQRINFMANDPDWPTFGLGWARRLAGLPFRAVTMAA